MKKIMSGKYESMIPRKECYVICFTIADGIKGGGRYAFAPLQHKWLEFQGTNLLRFLQHNMF
jgi:hypothetical protein